MENCCRLCLGTHQLLNLFQNSPVDAEALTDIITSATGILIQRADQVTKKICLRCYTIVLKIDRFRTLSATVNELLHERCEFKQGTDNQMDDTAVTVPNNTELVSDDLLQPISPLRISKIQSNTVNGNEFVISRVESLCTTDNSEKETVTRKRSIDKNLEQDDVTVNKKMRDSPESEDIMNQIFICSLCNDIFSSKIFLGVHFRIHRHCKKCNKQFRCLRDMDRHLRNHCRYMKNPKVYLPKIDKDPYIVKKYNILVNNISLNVEENKGTNMEISEANEIENNDSLISLPITNTLSNNLNESRCVQYNSKEASIDLTCDKTPGSIQEQSNSAILSIKQGLNEILPAPILVSDEETEDEAAGTLKCITNKSSSNCPNKVVILETNSDLQPVSTSLEENVENSTKKTIFKKPVVIIVDNFIKNNIPLIQNAKVINETTKEQLTEVTTNRGNNCPKSSNETETSSMLVNLLCTDLPIKDAPSQLDKSSSQSGNCKTPVTDENNLIEMNSKIIETSENNKSLNVSQDIIIIDDDDESATLNICEEDILKKTNSNSVITFSPKATMKTTELIQTECVNKVSPNCVNSTLTALTVVSSQSKTVDTIKDKLKKTDSNSVITFSPKATMKTTEIILTENVNKVPPNCVNSTTHNALNVVSSQSKIGDTEENTKSTSTISASTCATNKTLKRNNLVSPKATMKPTKLISTKDVNKVSPNCVNSTLNTLSIASSQSKTVDTMENTKSTSTISASTCATIKTSKRNHLIEKTQSSNASIVNDGIANDKSQAKEQQQDQTNNRTKEKKSQVKVQRQDQTNNRTKEKKSQAKEQQDQTNNRTNEKTFFLSLEKLEHEQDQNKVINEKTVSPPTAEIEQPVTYQSSSVIYPQIALVNEKKIMYEPNVNCSENEVLKSIFSTSRQPFCVSDNSSIILKDIKTTLKYENLPIKIIMSDDKLNGSLLKLKSNTDIKKLAQNDDSNKSSNGNVNLSKSNTDIRQLVQIDNSCEPKINVNLPQPTLPIPIKINDVSTVIALPNNTFVSSLASSIPSTNTSSNLIKTVANSKPMLVTYSLQHITTPPSTNLPSTKLVSPNITLAQAKVGNPSKSVLKQANITPLVSKPILIAGSINKSVNSLPTLATFKTYSMHHPRVTFYPTNLSSLRTSPKTSKPIASTISSIATTTNPVTSSKSNQGHAFSVNFEKLNRLNRPPITMIRNLNFNKGINLPTIVHTHLSDTSTSNSKKSTIGQNDTSPKLLNNLGCNDMPPLLGGFDNTDTATCSNATNDDKSQKSTTPHVPQHKETDANSKFKLRVKGIWEINSNSNM